MTYQGPILNPFPGAPTVASVQPDGTTVTQAVLTAKVPNWSGLPPLAPAGPPPPAWIFPLPATSPPLGPLPYVPPQRTWPVITNGWYNAIVQVTLVSGTGHPAGYVVSQDPAPGTEVSLWPTPPTITLLVAKA